MRHRARLFALWNVKLKARDRGGAHDRWYRIARRVMARPGLIAALTALVMIVLALPSLRAVWTPVDIGTVPEGLSARTVGDALARDFPRQDSSPLLLIANGRPEDESEVHGLARRVAALDGVAAVQPPRRLDDSTWQIDAIARGDAAGEDARGAVRAIRSDAGPLPVLVGGEGAEFIDQQDSIGSRLLLAIALLASFTFVVLWLMTGSVVLPIKALVMNALTVGATLGLLALIFQDGRFEGLLGYTANGGIEPTDFLVTATLVFALSTDYGVFLLGRIKEAHDAGMPDREAVAVGLARTGAVVTAAAVLLAVAIGAFVTSEVLFIKQ
ncbi:MAG: MMPL family transporter, partial [Solirubrobacterales bacterium]|nr:MMPL family transporter [Solirubrobacterales bacterium]